MEGIRVLIVDDESLVRRALTVFLERSERIQVVGEAQDGAAAVELVRVSRPDVVVMDLQMPGMNGIEATAQITTRWPSTRVLAVTTYGSIESVLPVLRAGASGYLLKDTEPEDIVTAVENIHAGAGVLSPKVTKQLIASIRSDDDTPATTPLTPIEELSQRERQVVELLGTGKSNAEISQAMHVSEATVKSHLSSVMAKWNTRDRVQVLIRAARAGLVTFR